MHRPRSHLAALAAVAVVVAVGPLVGLGAATGGGGRAAAADRVIGRDPAAASAPAALPILGFQSEDASPSLVTRDAPALGAVGVDGLNLAGPPGSVSATDAAQRRQLLAAHRARRPADLLVGNFSPRIDDFSEPLAWRTLRSAAARELAAGTLAADVRAEGWNGISVDLESLRRRDRAGLVAFVGDLRRALGSGASLTVCVESFTAASAYPDNGYDLRGLAGAASGLVLMAYDEHGPWERTPGPIGAQRWVVGGLRAVLASVPGRRIDLGVAGYGYVWARHDRRQLSDAAAWRLVRAAGAHPRWVAQVGEWTARLPEGGTVWWSDARTLALRERLARRSGLQGLAVWSLGLAGRLQPVTRRPSDTSAPARSHRTRGAARGRSAGRDAAG